MTAEEKIENEVAKLMSELVGGAPTANIILYSQSFKKILSQARSTALSEAIEIAEGMRINKGQLGSPNPKLFTEVIKWRFWDDSLKKESNEMWQTAVSARIAVERNNTIGDLITALKKKMEE